MTSDDIILAILILIAVIATVKYTRADTFSWHLFWPSALASIALQRGWPGG